MREYKNGTFCSCVSVIFTRSDWKHKKMESLMHIDFTLKENDMVLISNTEKEQLINRGQLRQLLKQVACCIDEKYNTLVVNEKEETPKAAHWTSPPVTIVKNKLRANVLVKQFKGKLYCHLQFFKIENSTYGNGKKKYWQGSDNFSFDQYEDFAPIWELIGSA